MLNPTSRATVALLAALTALGPLATDMYLPAMPAMRESLATGADEIQLTLSLYLIGFAVAQLLCGPLSDRYGRKPVLLGGMLLFLVASLVCAFAPDVEVLLAGRFLQALGGLPDRFSGVPQYAISTAPSRPAAFCRTWPVSWPSLLPWLHCSARLCCCGSAGIPSLSAWRSTLLPCWS